MSFHRVILNVNLFLTEFNVVFGINTNNILHCLNLKIGLTEKNKFFLVTIIKSLIVLGFIFYSEAFLIKTDLNRINKHRIM